MAQKPAIIAAASGFVGSCLHLVGGSVRVLRARVPAPAPPCPTCRRLVQSTEQRHRAGGPSPPVEGPQAPGEQATSSPPRPVVHGRAGGHHFSPRRATSSPHSWPSDL